LVTTRPKVFRVEQLIEQLIKQFPAIKSVMQNINDQNTNAIFGKEWRVLYGQDYITDQMLGNSFQISGPAFYQVNTEMAEKLYQTAIDFAELRAEDIVIDAYSGIGTIGLSVARDKALTLVEVNKSAYEELATNSTRVVHATNNQLIHPILAKSEEVLDQISADASVILDPPRAGCDQKLIQKLCEVQPQKIVYLSCNPVTQVRDLSSLLQHYNIQSIQGFNFFPHTPHIESLVLLTLK